MATPHTDSQANGSNIAPPQLTVEVSKEFEKQFLDTAGGFNAPILIKRINRDSHQEETIRTSPAQLLEALSGYMINLTMTLATVNQNLVLIGQKLEAFADPQGPLAALINELEELRQSVEQNTDVAERQLEEDDVTEEPQQIFPEPPPRSRPRKRG